ncbi:MAG: hypothetical protein IK010_04805 [Bacteroidales bacterium]|nr:hypothetical protein [Bacteroidales bacterium]
MNRTKLIIAVVLTALTLNAAAQYSQLGSKNEFMLKMELGYAPFMGNMGQAGDHGYYLSKFHNATGANIMLGANISQDWFIGAGAGFNYYHNMVQGMAEPLMGANVFVDVDFRPIWKGVMGLDYQPTTIKWAPLVGLRAGGSALLGKAEPESYGTTLTPMAEFYGGINWYYMHGLHNMEHNWHSFYATIGVAYMQQTVYLPVRVGWRW